MLHTAVLLSSLFFFLVFLVSAYSANTGIESEKETQRKDPPLIAAVHWLYSCPLLPYSTALLFFPPVNGTGGMEANTHIHLQLHKSSQTGRRRASALATRSAASAVVEPLE